jgi:Raf kinase inhibitor-like YbhB/YbcL family protein
LCARRWDNVTFALTSSAFKHGGPIPVEHTCDGEDIAPPLAWSGAPAGVRAFALIADDPDAPAGTWVHWVLINLPGTATALPEAAAQAAPGSNDFRKTGYGGPCPPPGNPHRYVFTLYALDGALALKAGPTKADVERAMLGHILGTAQLVGTYARQRR